MENNVENIKSQIEERLKELANIQPKNDVLKYLEKCKEVYEAYYMTIGAVNRQGKWLGDDGVIGLFDDVLKKAEEILKEDF